jgi:hypothetical protein
LICMSDQVYDVLMVFSIIVVVLIAYGIGHMVGVHDALDCSMCLCKAVVP